MRDFPQDIKAKARNLVSTLGLPINPNTPVTFETLAVFLKKTLELIMPLFCGARSKFYSNDRQLAARIEANLRLALIMKYIHALQALLWLHLLLLLTF